jgi:hypothetical protein
MMRYSPSDARMAVTAVGFVLGLVWIWLTT